LGFEIGKWKNRCKIVYMFLLESAPFNIGKGKLYEGIPGNLIAHA